MKKSVKSSAKTPKMSKKNATSMMMKKGGMKKGGMKSKGMKGC